jgi:hypothetical protein
MNARKILHDIVDPADPLRILLANAPADDEPFDPTDLEGTDDEPLIPHAEVVQTCAG